MRKLAFIFNSFPHTTAAGREGLDALLAASAFSEDIIVFFVGDGVTQLLKAQQPSETLSRDYISAFKLMDLYDIEQVYVCQRSLNQFGLSTDNLLIDVTVVEVDQLARKLAQCQQILTF
ncbi:sulfurtransferase complex subunit TusC [Vibrio cyclitrophicus]|uniref:sulfurtransferase complex subunit TusC n=1 Tax=Vibrio cyclitrophicus TaxID=47951 RepID=UPI0002FE1703|nr:sulfurtransferase complex subunit TusC [Vibrio cyclitrophicus]OBT18236.1 tRNA 2-thiouridine(34) synthase TusC [Vibrio cyclitrophicus]OEE30447.1 sulfurtransferase TusC [Vibrio cyclitrophicus ZF170]PME17822.1 sulfurtransferase TusC [Vibrio cyclitrophicus]PME79175.1 sulfurtransferase TusC [Vibrio cyclitrophicus]PME87969.1 sulfurtransferase TusC [Vibrio cyclitrophicus]